MIKITYLSLSLIILLSLTSQSFQNQDYAHLPESHQSRLLANATLTESEKIQSLELWKIIVKTRVDFIKDASGYKKELTNYGVSFDTIYSYLNKPEDWIKLVQNFKKFSLEMNDTQLKNIVHMLEFLPSMDDIIYLVSTNRKDHTDFIESWVNMVRISNNRDWTRAHTQLLLSVCTLMTVYGGKETSDIYKFCKDSNNRKLDLQEERLLKIVTKAHVDEQKFMNKIFLKKGKEKDPAILKELKKMYLVLTQKD